MVVENVRFFEAFNAVVIVVDIDNGTADDL